MSQESDAPTIQAIDRVVTPQAVDSAPDISIVESSPTRLFKCQACHVTFLTEVGLHAHHAKYPLYAESSLAEVADIGLKPTTTMKAPKVIIKYMLACQPEGPCPEPAKMY